MEEIDLIFLEGEEKMEKVLTLYNSNLMKISVGRPNPQILNAIKVDYYGDLTPIPQIANVLVPEARQLLIKPYEVKMVKPMVQVITASMPSFTVLDEGDKIRITFPEMTTERRKELVKMFGNYTEQSKVSIRGIRHECIKMLKSLKLSEDEEKHQMETAQKLTDKFVEKVNKRSLEKKDELMQM